MTTRVAVYIDYQNTYKGARRAFDGLDGHHCFGQIYPRRLGVLVTQRGREVDPDRQLEFVKVFRGEPDAQRSPRGQAACQRQVRFWEAQASVSPITRPLKYYPVRDGRGNVVDWEAREKGIDVLLALGMVMDARDDLYDVAVVMSADTDLVPAVEAVMRLGRRCEVAGWNSATYRQRLSVPNGRVWCHWLHAEDYKRLEDPTDYTLPNPDDPTAEP